MQKIRRFFQELIGCKGYSIKVTNATLPGTKRLAFLGILVVITGCIFDAALAGDTPGMLQQKNGDGTCFENIDLESNSARARVQIAFSLL